jgi:hypothetical protein
MSRIGLLVGLIGLLAIAWMGSRMLREDDISSVYARPRDKVYVVQTGEHALVFEEYDYAMEYARGDESKVRTVSVLRRPD